MQRPTICITPKTFNADKLNVSDPKEIKTKANISMKLSNISYSNEENEPCDLYISLPAVETYGPYPQYKFNSINKSANDICGYTISYSNKDANKMFEKINKICSKKLKKYTIKQVFNKNKNNVEIAYFKLKMNGENISTNFYFNKECTKSINALDIVSKYGSMTPMIYLRSIYFGGHGSSEYSANFQINVVKAIFNELQSYIPDFNIDEEEEKED